MIIDGRHIAQTVFSSLSLSGVRLGILVGEVTPVIQSFVRIKERAAERLGVELVRVKLPPTSTEDAIVQVRELAERVDGLIVQLPLPTYIDTEAVLASIPSEKDVDGISPSPTVRPPVAGAMCFILDMYGVAAEDVQAVVVGSGRLVGRPCAAALRERGAQVTILKKGDDLAPLQSADIVVLGAGNPGFIRPEHLKQGVVLIDAGTSETDGKVKGDADSACAEKASIFTPVPGGIGPIAVAMIFKNLSDLRKQ